MTLSVESGEVCLSEIFLDFVIIINESQPWRLLTNFFYVDTTYVGAVVHLLFLRHYSQKLEEGHFAGRSADYLVFLVMCGVLLTAAAALMGRYHHPDFLSFALLSSVVHLWARLNRTQTVKIFGRLFTVESVYLSVWVLMAVKRSMPAPTRHYLLGIFACEFFYFPSTRHCLLGIFAGEFFYFLDRRGLGFLAPAFLCAPRCERPPINARARAYMRARGGSRDEPSARLRARETRRASPAARVARSPTACPRVPVPAPMNHPFHGPLPCSPDIRSSGALRVTGAMQLTAMRRSPGYSSDQSSMWLRGRERVRQRNCHKLRNKAELKSGHCE